MADTSSIVLNFKNPLWSELEPHARPLFLSPSLKHFYDPFPRNTREHMELLIQLVDQLTEEESLVAVYQNSKDRYQLHCPIGRFDAWIGLDHDLCLAGWNMRRFYAVNLKQCHQLFTTDRNRFPLVPKVIYRDSLNRMRRLYPPR